jgi:hypothetical protein
MNATATDDAQERRLRVAVAILVRGVRRALGREMRRGALPELDGEVDETAASQGARLENQTLPVPEREAVMAHTGAPSAPGAEQLERRPTT